MLVTHEHAKKTVVNLEYVQNHVLIYGLRFQMNQPGLILLKK